MTNEELAAIRQTCAETTPEPWESHVVTCCSLHYSHPGGGQHTNVTRSWAVGPIARSSYKAKADADFIAGAREWVPQLLAEVERLQAASHGDEVIVDEMVCEAVRHEREACAQVAEEEARRARGGVGFSDTFQGRALAAEAIVASIRQRGAKPEEHP